MKTKFLTSSSNEGKHQIAYKDWGDKNNPNVLFCAHGLTRNKHDFTPLAQQLSSKRRVICFDFPGRGESDWLSNKNSYDINQYVKDSMAILEKINVVKVDWLGTSMGGLVGIHLAAMNKSPINRFIINDVGPFISKEAVKRIGEYVGLVPEFNSHNELETYMREIYASFGTLSDEQWKQMVTHGQRILENGKLALNYDPEISVAFTNAPSDNLDLWSLWEGIDQPILIIHGEESDLLAKATVTQMLQTKPSNELLSIPRTGHAPALMNKTDIKNIDMWLDKAL